MSALAGRDGVPYADGTVSAAFITTSWGACEVRVEPGMFEQRVAACLEEHPVLRTGSGWRVSGRCNTACESGVAVDGGRPAGPEGGGQDDYWRNGGKSASAMYSTGPGDRYSTQHIPGAAMRVSSSY